MNDLTSVWLTGGFGVHYQTCLMCFARFAWATWITRNKMCMQKNFLNKPTDIIYLGLSFIQKWKLLMKVEAKNKMEDLLALVLNKLKEFKLLNSYLSDVGFI
jgi:hypothetical protein